LWQYQYRCSAVYMPICTSTFGFICLSTSGYVCSGRVCVCCVCVRVRDAGTDLVKNSRNSSRHVTPSVSSTCATNATSPCAISMAVSNGAWGQCWMSQCRVVFCHIFAQLGISCLKEASFLPNLSVHRPVSVSALCVSVSVSVLCVCVCVCVCFCVSACVCVWLLSLYVWLFS
jgi:hypothetical protein